MQIVAVYIICFFFSSVVYNLIYLFRVPFSLRYRQKFHYLPLQLWVLRKCPTLLFYNKNTQCTEGILKIRRRRYTCVQLLFPPISLPPLSFLSFFSPFFFFVFHFVYFLCLCGHSLYTTYVSFFVPTYSSIYLCSFRNNFTFS